MSLRVERQATPFKCPECDAPVEFVKDFFDSWQGGEQLRSTRYECSVMSGSHDVSSVGI